MVGVFSMHSTEDKYAALESTVYSGQHVGILEDGGLKPPGDTPARDRASLFIPFPHSPATAVSEQTYTHVYTVHTHMWMHGCTSDSMEYSLHRDCYGRLAL